MGTNDPVATQPRAGLSQRRWDVVWPRCTLVCPGRPTPKGGDLKGHVTPYSGSDSSRFSPLPPHPSYRSVPCVRILARDFSPFAPGQRPELREQDDLDSVPAAATKFQAHPPSAAFTETIRSRRIRPYCIKGLNSLSAPVPWPGFSRAPIPQLPGPHSVFLVSSRSWEIKCWKRRSASL